MFFRQACLTSPARIRTAFEQSVVDDWQVACAIIAEHDRGTGAPVKVTQVQLFKPDAAPLEQDAIAPSKIAEEALHFCHRFPWTAL